MQPDVPQLPEGTTLRDGQYQILYTISQGGFGNVYRAIDKSSQKDIAVKEAFFNDDETREQFAVESQVLIHLNHPAIVHGIETFEENCRFYLVMQYIDGFNLEELQIEYFKTRRHPIPEALVLRIMSAICEATQALHHERILHRDIKPANIKIDGTGQPILLDLGLAKLFRTPGSVTLAAARAFTPGYAPPEQCEEGGSTNELTDVYALGATMYYALTGRQPWESLKRLTELHMGHRDMPAPSHFVPTISKATDRVVIRALKLNPAERFSSPEAMGHAIHEALHHLGRPQEAHMPSLVCPTCGARNSPESEFCGNCGSSLHPTKSLGKDAPHVKTVAVPTHVPTTQVMEPLKPIPELPAAPEPMARRVPIKPRRSALAGLAFGLALFSLCPPMDIVAFVSLPIALSARRNIHRSQGATIGLGRANMAIVISLLAIAELILWIYLLTHGELFGI
jgi:serine/threonine protein kinase